MSTRSRMAFVALAAALGLAGCEGGLFAPAASLPPHVELAIVATAATDSAAFESVDAIRVQLLGTLGAGALLDSTLAFRSAGAETRVHLDVHVDDAQVPVTIAVELRTGGLAVFRGTASALLERGETTSVAVPIVRVLAAVLPAGRADTSRARG